MKAKHTTGIVRTDVATLLAEAWSAYAESGEPADEAVAMAITSVALRLPKPELKRAPTRVPIKAPRLIRRARGKARQAGIAIDPCRSILGQMRDLQRASHD